MILILLILLLYNNSNYSKNNFNIFLFILLLVFINNLNYPINYNNTSNIVLGSFNNQKKYNDNGISHYFNCDEHNSNLNNYIDSHSLDNVTLNNENNNLTENKPLKKDFNSNDSIKKNSIEKNNTKHLINTDNSLVNKTFSISNSPNTIDTAKNESLTKKDINKTNLNSKSTKEIYKNPSRNDSKISHSVAEKSNIIHKNIIALENNLPSNLHSYNTLNNSVSSIIMNKYRNVTISILISGFGIITGKPFLFLKDALCLKLENNTIVFINYKFIKSFY